MIKDFRNIDLSDDALFITDESRIARLIENAAHLMPWDRSEFSDIQYYDSPENSFEHTFGDGYKNYRLSYYKNNRSGKELYPIYTFTTAMEELFKGDDESLSSKNVSKWCTCTICKKEYLMLPFETTDSLRILNECPRCYKEKSYRRSIPALFEIAEDLPPLIESDSITEVEADALDDILSMSLSVSSNNVIDTAMPRLEIS